MQVKKDCPLFRIKEVFGRNNMDCALVSINALYLAMKVVWFILDDE